MPFGVGVEKMVRGRIVLVDAAFDEAHAEDAGVEIEILLRRTGNRRDVMNPVDALHGHVIPAKRIGLDQDDFLSCARSAPRICA